MASERILNAAGGVVWRKRTSSTTNGSSIEVLLIHQLKYYDLTLPQGKCEPGETLAQTAGPANSQKTGTRLALEHP